MHCDCFHQIVGTLQWVDYPLFGMYSSMHTYTFLHTYIEFLVMHTHIQYIHMYNSTYIRIIIMCNNEYDIKVCNVDFCLIIRTWLGVWLDVLYLLYLM